MSRPRIEYYWTQRKAAGSRAFTPDVNWRLIAANGEVMCQSFQGFRDKADARRSVGAVMTLLTNFNAAYGPFGFDLTIPSEVGPGPRPVSKESL